MIRISKSETADTRTCDFSQVTKEQLKASSLQHIGDVQKAMDYFKFLLEQRAAMHDFDKLCRLDLFHADFLTGFAKTEWWDDHRKLNRHHLLQSDGVREDVNLLDVLEMIADCVMAGMARKGEVYPLNIDAAVLMEAFNNTADLLKSQIQVKG